MQHIINSIHLPLALITDPTWIFFVVLIIILFSPILLKRLRTPHIIGLILAGVLIGQHGFNLRALKSRPTKELVWDYFFYVEGEGNIHSWQGKAMLEELEKCCSQLKVAGTYEKEIHI